MLNSKGVLGVVSVFMTTWVVSCGISSTGSSGETHFVTCHTTRDCEKLGPDYSCSAGECKVPEPPFTKTCDGGRQCLTGACDGGPCPTEKPGACDGAPCPTKGTRACGGADLDTDPQNCGVCGRDCLGGACRGGVCQPITLAQGMAPHGIVVDGTFVYWVDYRQGSLMKVARDGGTPTTLAGGLLSPEGLALRSGELYWTDEFGLGRVSISGEGPMRIASTSVRPQFLAVDASGAYWSAVGEVQWIPWAARDGGVAGVGPDAGAPLTLTDLSASGGNGLYDDVATDADFIYATFGPIDVPGAVVKIPRGGGPAVTLATPVDPAGIAVDSRFVYWANASFPGTVMKVPLSGGTPITLATGQESPVQLVVDDLFVYWTNFHGQSVMKAPLDGGAAVTVADGQFEPYDIVVDDEAVYWTDNSLGTVKKVAK